MNPPSANEQPPGKRQRTLIDASNTLPPNKSAEKKTCHFDFTKLPYDLIAEILIQTQNPKDVLAVARCSKALCWMLTDPSARYVWKHTRINCIVASMPAPIERFTESSWAAWIFDGGPCEVCGNHTDEMRVSYVLNMRVCQSSFCKLKIRTWRDRERVTIYAYQDVNHLLQYIPVLEAQACLSLRRIPISALGSHEINLVRRADWDRINLEFEEARKEAGDNWVEGNLAPLPNHKLPPPLDWAELLVWQQTYERHVQDLRGRIVLLTQRFAASEGYQVEDLENSPTFQSLLKKCVKARRPIQGEDVWPLYETIDDEVRRIMENRSQRENAKMSATARVVISRFYDDLQRQGTFKPLPAFSTFCQQIPIINSLMKNSVKDCPMVSPGGITMALGTESHIVRSMFLRELKEWQDRARDGLSEVLGCGGWKYAGKSMDNVHPTKNAGARFKCSNPGCAKLADKYKFRRDAGSLTYTQAIAHECTEVRNGKRKKVRRWDPSNFVRDETSISALKQFVHQTWDASEEVIHAGILVCKSCTPPVVLTVGDVAGHAQRHEEMEIEVVDSEEKMKAAFATRNLQPIIPGLANHMLGPAYEKKNKFAGLRNYRCVYCVPKTDQSTGDPKKPFDFNGLRSHLKAKHGITRPRDEDYYTEVPLQMPGSV
ncbi:hypothetical protein BDN72DRAFT_834612 [Pluteus cervinus]|uniref:Uncharacterized protein n=1 Tax=Pluteus cervinus TaxID=181527 RepID=A0ACD3B6N2_9AGAR|nr:hypothetical protein BDN72DRAFT_834612 [Pluteus cervinus]